MRSPLDTLHTQIVKSSDPDTKYSPFGENTTLFIQEKCPIRVLMRSPIDTLHKPIVLSSDADANCFPFGENTTLFTSFSCP